MMRASEGILEDLITILLSWWICVFRLSFFCLLNKLKEKQSEKVSITLKPRENSGWSGAKEENTLLNLLLISTKCPLIDLY